MAAANRTQISSVLSQAGLGDISTSFLNVIATGYVSDTTVAPGTHMDWMALKRAGKRVPEDISLVGFDDNFHARHLTPGLTTVRQPVDEIGRLAAKLLSQIVAGEELESKEITVPTQLVIRESVGRPARQKANRGTIELAR